MGKTQVFEALLHNSHGILRILLPNGVINGSFSSGSPCSLALHRYPRHLANCQHRSGREPFGSITYVRRLCWRRWLRKNIWSVEIVLEGGGGGAMPICGGDGYVHGATAFPNKGVIKCCCVPWWPAGKIVPIIKSRVLLGQLPEPAFILLFALLDAWT